MFPLYAHGFGLKTFNLLHICGSLVLELKSPCLYVGNEPYVEVWPVSWYFEGWIIQNFVQGRKLWFESIWAGKTFAGKLLGYLFN